jgi:hypothetical protein
MQGLQNLMRIRVVLLHHFQSITLVGEEEQQQLIYIIICAGLLAPQT